jgi:hypothetical protein
MPDTEDEALVGNESLWMAASGVIREAWDGVRERMHVRGGTWGYAQVNTDERV